MSRDEKAKKHPKGCFFACCPPCRRRHSPAGSAARSPSGAKDIGMQPMSASDIPVVLTGGITDVKTADDLLRDGAADLIGVGRSICKDPGWAKGIP